MTKHPRQVPLPSSIETFHTTKRHIQYQNVPSSIKSTSLNGLLVKLSKDNGDLYLPDDDLSLFAGLNPYSRRQRGDVHCPQVSGCPENSHHHLCRRKFSAPQILFWLLKDVSKHNNYIFHAASCLALNKWQNQPGNFWRKVYVLSVVCSDLSFSPLRPWQQYPPRIAVLEQVKAIRRMVATGRLAL